MLFFNRFFKRKNAIQRAIKNNYRWQGYYWTYLTNENYPFDKLSDEEFLKYRQEKLFTKSKEMKERLSLSKRKVERPSREKLKNLIRSTPFTTIGTMFGVVDSTIRKWCDYYDLPNRVKDIKAISDEDWENI